MGKIKTKLFETNDKSYGLIQRNYELYAKAICAFGFILMVVALNNNFMDINSFILMNVAGIVLTFIFNKAYYGIYVIFIYVVFCIKPDIGYVGLIVLGIIPKITLRILEVFNVMIGYNFTKHNKKVFKKIAQSIDSEENDRLKKLQDITLITGINNVIYNVKEKAMFIDLTKLKDGDIIKVPKEIRYISMIDENTVLQYNRYRQLADEKANKMSDQELTNEMYSLLEKISIKEIVQGWESTSQVPNIAHKHEGEPVIRLCLRKTECANDNVKVDIQEIINPYTAGIMGGGGGFGGPLLPNPNTMTESFRLDIEESDTELIAFGLCFNTNFKKRKLFHYYMIPSVNMIYLLGNNTCSADYIERCKSDLISRCGVLECMELVLSLICTLNNLVNHNDKEFVSKL